MFDDGFDVFASYEVEEFEDGAVEEVVAGHGRVDDVDDGEEELFLHHLTVVEFVAGRDEIAEEFHGSLLWSVCALD